jgi:hypothetical protein
MLWSASHRAVVENENNKFVKDRDYQLVQKCQGGQERRTERVVAQTLGLGDDSRQVKRVADDMRQTRRGEANNGGQKRMEDGPLLSIFCCGRSERRRRVVCSGAGVRVQF